MSARSSTIDVHGLFGIEGRSPRDLQALQQRLDEVLSMRNANERRQALLALVRRNRDLQATYGNNVDGLEQELRDARATLEASRLSQEKAQEKPGFLTRVKNSILNLPSTLWKHKWKIAIAGAVGLGAWYFWPYITGYLNKWMSKAPQRALEQGMAMDRSLLRPDAPVSPLPLTPTPLESDLAGGMAMPGSPLPPPIPPDLR